jgi:exopolyphosphatase/guanosine-5'-triphosphate,3'-diphosphate pyrophosphatase
VPDTIAAIDLGSNSFHLIVTRLTDGHLQVVDRLREMVQLAAGLDNKQRLSAEAQAKALDCLARFGQRVRHIPHSRVRIIGTNTLRQARNSQEFLAKAETSLGHPVEIVSGIEEARLIYLGVAHSIADTEGRRLVVDIGGGSTELIIGEKFEPLHLSSLNMGCVSMTRRFFASGRIREIDLCAAELTVSVNMEPITLGFQDLGWSSVIGASGTIKTIQDIVLSEGWSREGITLTALQRLRTALLETEKVTTIAERWNLHPARAQVFTGGCIILHGLCQTLGVEHLQVADGALREGVIYDLLGRIAHEDVRDRTIATLCRRYNVDLEQAERVATTARHLLLQAQVDWGLEDEELAHGLEWAARLYEIGLIIAHSQYHRHGAYLLRHADMPGFSRSGQGLLAALVEGHRRKFPETVFAALHQDIVKPARYLCVLLRFAVVLHRSRSRQPLPSLRLQVKGPSIRLEFPLGWLEEHPLTRADLDEEARYLKKAGFTLSYAAVAVQSLNTLST